MKKLLFLLLFQIVTLNIFAQYNESIRTGRPGQAIGAFTVGKSVLQFQQGVDYYSFVAVKHKPTGLLSNNVVRYGILENVELSILVDYQNEQTQSDTTAVTLNGISNFHCGFRVHLNDQKGWIPTTGFQMRIKYPSVAKDFAANNLATVMVFVANWSLAKNLSFASNWILSFSGNDAVPTGKYVLNFAFPIYKKWSGFIENYGQIRQAVYQSRFDGGFAYLLNNNVQLDISAGYGDNQGIKDYFVSGGISWRIVTFRKN